MATNSGSNCKLLGYKFLFVTFSIAYSEKREVSLMLSLDIKGIVSIPQNRRIICLFAPEINSIIIMKVGLNNLIQTL